MSRYEKILLVILVVVAAGSIARMAFAADPECTGDTGITEIDAIDGNVEYCSPDNTASGEPFPAGEVMTCFLTEGGDILHQIDGIGPSIHVTATFPAIHWPTVIELYCQNDFGAGVAASVVANFPGVAPGAGYFLQAD